MKKILLLLVLINFSAFSQNYLKGYYSDNAGAKTDCLIYEFDFDDFPTKIEVKSDQNAKVVELDIKAVSGFGFYEGSNRTFERFEVSIDQSNDMIGKLGNLAQPNNVEKQLFLENLVKGKANLYVHKSTVNTRFFYRMDEVSPVTQLEYKKYQVANEIFENKRYKQMLLNSFAGSSITSAQLNNVEYKRDSLTRLFEKYNGNFGVENKIDTSKKKEKGLDFNVILRPGVNFSSMKYRSQIPFYKDFDFDPKTGFRFGVELEMMFNKRYALAIEPTYRTYKSEAKQDVGLLTPTVKDNEVEYNSIEIPLTFRRYFNLTDTFSLFANVSIQFDVLLGSTTPGFKSGATFSPGLGMRYNDKYYFEINYDTPRDLTRNDENQRFIYSNIGLILGYKLF